MIYYLIFMGRNHSIGGRVKPRNSRGVALVYEELRSEHGTDPTRMPDRLSIGQPGVREAINRMVMKSKATSAVHTEFPSHPVRPVWDFGDDGAFIAFREEGLIAAVGSLRNRRVPTLIGYPPRSLSSRGGKSKTFLGPGPPSSFRPLYMLDMAGKVIEKLVSD
ncbi:hypothetical protein J6590_011159 [Homalodisca vitripennis]|nr:hypothetical protein J6590_011159 [Homalodisca vitripennis]